MYPRRSHSEKSNTVLPCEWPQIELYSWNMISWKKWVWQSADHTFFCILYYRHCTIGLLSGTQHRALLFLLPFLVGNIRLNWMFCLASSYSHTTKYDLHSHFTDETTAHEENRQRRWRFLKVPLHWRVVTVALLLRTVSPRYYLSSQGYFLPSPVHTEIPRVMMNPLLKSRCAGKSLHTKLQWHKKMVLQPSA